MHRKRPSTPAVGAALLLVLAVMVVMSPGGSVTNPDADLLPDFDYGQSTPDESVALASALGTSTSDEQYGLYEELSTYVPTSSGQAVSSRADRAPEEDHGTDQRIHRWRCPICDATKLSLGSSAGEPAEAAANNLRSHLRNSDGHGHGPPGALPAGITTEVIDENVAVSALAD